MAIRVRDVNLPTVFYQLPRLRNAYGWTYADRLRGLAVLGCMYREYRHFAGP